MRSVLLSALALLTCVGGAQAAAPVQDELRRSAVVQAVERAGPAVVNIYTEEMVQRRDWSGDFFRDVFEPRYRRKMETTSLGSGVVIDGRGHVLTNFHVVQRGAKIKVALVDKREFEAKVVGTDPDLDLAVLKLETKEKLPFVPMGDSAALLIGETVIAIGNPFGLSNTVTTGVVSATHRNINAGGQTFYDFIQTDASINPGNSGGPLLNINGVLIGINTAIYGNAQGIGFAIPINRAQRIVRDLIEHGRIKQAYLGMNLSTLSEKDVKASGLPQKSAVKVVSVEADGPATRGGLKPGDIILSVEGFPIETPDDYTAKLRTYTPGDRVKMEVQRKGKQLDVVVVAGEVPPALADRIVRGQLGLVVEEITAQRIREHRLRNRKGVVVTEVQGGLAGARARVQPGDVIIQVGGVDVQGLDDFRQAVLRARRKGGAVFLIQRDRKISRVRFKL